MFPWADFRRTACGDDSDEETEHSKSGARAVPQPEEKPDSFSTSVLVWRGCAEAGRCQKEFADDLVDVSSDEGDSSQATPPSTAAEVENHEQTTFDHCNCRVKRFRERAGTQSKGKRSRKDAAMPTIL